MEGAPEWTSSNANIVAAEDGWPSGRQERRQGHGHGDPGRSRTEVPVEVVDVEAIDLATPALSLIGPIGTSVPLSCMVKDSKDTAIGAQADLLLARSQDRHGVGGRRRDLRRGRQDHHPRSHRRHPGRLRGRRRHPRRSRRLEIRPATALVHVGDSQHFQVTAYGPDGIAIPDVPRPPSSPRIRTWPPWTRSGVASGRKAGAAVIRVELAGKRPKRRCWSTDVNVDVNVKLRFAFQFHVLRLRSP